MRHETITQEVQLLWDRKNIAVGRILCMETSIFGKHMRVESPIHFISLDLYLT